MRPTRIEYRSAERVLILHGPGSREDFIPAALLRVCSPSAEVQGHGPGAPGVLPDHVDEIGIVAMDSVGTYAIKLHFSDGHRTGIFSWDYLADLALHKNQRWEDYLNARAERGIPKDGKNLLE